METVSIVIPNYNGKHFLENCLRSLERVLKECNYQWEVIVVDNGSTDGSIEYLKKQQWLTSITLSTNEGFSAAVNAGINASKSEYVYLLNNDTEVENGFLDVAIGFMEMKDNVFSVSSRMIQYHNRDLIDDAGDNINLSGWPYKRGDGKSISDSRFGSITDVFSSCAGAALYERAKLIEVGLFDEKLFAYREDFDIAYRARLRGYTNYYVPDSIVYHIGSGTTGSRYNDFKVRLSVRNLIVVIFKNMPLPQIVINLPFFLCGWVIKFAFFARKGFASSYLAGTAEAFKMSRGNRSKIDGSLKNHIKIQKQLFAGTLEYILDKLY